jgi:PAP2 superfamily
MKPLHSTVTITLGLLLLGVAPTATSLSASPTAGDVVNEWNAIAVRTIFTERLTPIPSGQVYLGFVSSAVYDAVLANRAQAKERGVRPSMTAAIATAAHDVLAEFFPDSAANLDTDLEATLQDVPDGRAEDRGVRIGAASATEVIDERAGDGREAATTLNVAPAPGVWRPTSPNTSMLVPWLGFVRPLLLDSPTQIDLDGPDALDSRRYTRDFAEVKAVGELDSTPRTARQTRTALFWNFNVVLMFNAAMRDLAEREQMGAREVATMFAAVNMTTADSSITCWRAKFDHAFWRPVTAIREAATDGNPATTADPTWTPLAETPPYPDYTSGHQCLTASVATGLAQLAGSDRIDINVTSLATGVPVTRHYTSATRMARQAFLSRIWLGIHFRTAMQDARSIGRQSSRLGFTELGLTDRHD